MSLAAKVVKGAALKNPRPRKAVLTLVTSINSPSLCVAAARMNYFDPHFSLDALPNLRYTHIYIHTH